MSRAPASRAAAHLAKPTWPVALAGWLGFAFGSIGAAALAVNMPWSGWGWLAFLASNVAWIHYARLTRSMSLLLQQFVFLVTTFVGIWRWLA